jgi:hypothetical protein
MLNFYRTWVAAGLIQLSAVPEPYQTKLRDEGLSDSEE